MIYYIIIIINRKIIIYSNINNFFKNFLEKVITLIIFYEKYF